MPRRAWGPAGEIDRLASSHPIFAAASACRDFGLPGQELGQVEGRFVTGVAAPGERGRVLVDPVEDHQMAASVGGRGTEHSDLVVEGAGDAAIFSAQSGEHWAVEVFGLGHFGPDKDRADRGILRADMRTCLVDVAQMACQWSRGIDQRSRACLRLA